MLEPASPRQVLCHAKILKPFGLPEVVPTVSCHCSQLHGRLVPLLLLGRGKEVQDGDEELPASGNGNGCRRANLSIDESTDERAGDQSKEKGNPSGPWSVLQGEEPLVNHKIDPGRRGHGSADLRHVQAARLHDLAPSSKSQQPDHPKGCRALIFDAVSILHPRGSQNEAGLDKVAKNEPPSLPGADDVAQLARQPSGSQEQTEGHSDIRRDERFAVQVGKDEGQAQEDGVASLIGGEAAVVEERSGILTAARCSVNARGRRVDVKCAHLACRCKTSG